MIDPYSQGTRTASSPENHRHSPLASRPLTLNSVSQGRGAVHSRAGWWMCQKSKVRKSDGKGEMLSPAQALQGRPAPPHDQGVPTSLDAKRKKDFFFPLSIPNHGFICLKLQVLLKYEYVKINKALVFTVPAHLGDLHGFFQCF